MPATMLDEMDRQRILDKWDSISRNAAGVTSAMADMRSKVLSSVENLRLRQVAIAELVLAGEFEGAINSLKKWLSAPNAAASLLDTPSANLMLVLEKNEALSDGES